MCIHKARYNQLVFQVDDFCVWSGQGLNFLVRSQRDELFIFDCNRTDSWLLTVQRFDLAVDENRIGLLFSLCLRVKGDSQRKTQAGE